MELPGMRRLSRAEGRRRLQQYLCDEFRSSRDLAAEAGLPYISASIILRQMAHDGVAERRYARSNRAPLYRKATN